MGSDKPVIHDEPQGRLAKAYDHIMQHAGAIVDRARSDAMPQAKHLLEAARDKAVEAGDLTREEADKLLDYIARDLGHAAVYMEKYERDFSDWLRFDIALLERGIAHSFAKVADHTRGVIDDFAVRADVAGWKTGEVVGPGTLHCKNCRQTLHFHKTGHIPPCPQCQHTAFDREHELG